MNVKSKTYVPRVKRMSAVGSAFDEMFFSQEDKQLAKSIRSRMASGELTTPEAHAQMEQIRARYNYSGGEDGSGYHAIPVQASKYVSKYDSELKKATRDALQTEPFSYDADKDPYYRMARQAHLAAGERSMDDTVARVSARTGGLASSYAAKAGQDAYLNYADKADELLPQYEERAYRRYLQENQDRRDKVELLQKLDAEAYGRWRDRENVLREERENAVEKTYRYGKDAADSAYREEKDAADAAYRKEKDAADAAYRKEKDTADAAYRKEKDTADATYRKEKDTAERTYRKEQDAAKAQGAARESARKDVERHLSAGGDWRELPEEILKNAGFSEKQMEQMAAAFRKKEASAEKTALQQTIYKTGYRPTDAELAAAGMSREEADEWAAAHKATLPSSSSVSGNTRSKTKKETQAKQSPQYKSAVTHALEFNNIEAAFAYLDRCVEAGFITETERMQIIVLELGVELKEPTA